MSRDLPSLGSSLQALSVHCPHEEENETESSGLRDLRSQKWKFREAELSESCREELHNA